eukprot:g26448.t1
MDELHKAQPWIKGKSGIVLKPKKEAYKLARKRSKPEDWEKFNIQQWRIKGLIWKGEIEYKSKLAENDVTSSEDNGKSVNVVYLEFQKTFDKVPYRRLVKKIKAHDIG